jgi:hypothetical protein
LEWSLAVRDHAQAEPVPNGESGRVLSILRAREDLAMTIKEMDKLCSKVNVEEMVRAIGLDMDDYANFAWQQTGHGKISPIAAGNMMRIGALIGLMYATKILGGTLNEGQKGTFIS